MAPGAPVAPGAPNAPGAPRASGASPRPRAAVWVCFAVIGVLLAAYLGFLIEHPAHHYSEWLDGWGIDAVEILASALCLARAAGRRQHRAVPLVLGLGLLSWSLGDTVLTIESLGGATPHTPSIADAFYLGFFPLAYVAMIMFMRGEIRRINSPSWLDSAVAGLGAASVCAAFAFQNVVSATGETPIAVAVNLAYPVGDLLLLVLVVGSTAMLGGRRKTPWVLMASGMALNVVGDTFNLLGPAAGAEHVGVVLNGIAWPVAILLMSIAVWVPRGHSDPLALPKPTGFLLPGLAATAGLGVLVASALGDDSIGQLAVAFATSTLAAVGVRLAVSVRSLRTLTVRHEQHSVTDYLTGLGNRRYLFGVLNAFFEEQQAGDEQRSLAFLFIDLDRFKEINDSFGHPAGDELLRQIGPRLTKAVGSAGSVVRLGGDELAVVLMDADADVAVKVAERIITEIGEPFLLNKIRATVGASIGIALVPSNATDPSGLLWCADVAMYRAKLGNIPFVFYDQDIDGGEDQPNLLDELRIAVKEGDFVLHYQPQLDLKTGQILAVEALIRWPHAKLGLVPPMKFLPLAEDAGLMWPLTTWVLNEALAQCAAWRSSGRLLAVSVNVATTDLLEAEFLDLVKGLLTRYNLPGEAVVIEITETTIIKDFLRAQSVILGLRELGVVVSIDDFGAGFTSLAYLSSLAVGELKLDRAFITALNAEGRGRDLELVRATINLGHEMGLRVVAEGIEDVETLDLIGELGCDLAQGYFISRPSPASRLSFNSSEVMALAEPTTV